MLKLFKNNEYDNKDYTKGKVYKALKKDGIAVTEQGIQKARVADPDTLHKIGDAYYKKEKYEKAFTWFHKAALLDHADSQAQVGWMYEEGQGVSKDYKQAMDFSMKAASKGNANGQCNIGDLYYFGYGVSIDYKQALGWYLKAANNGNTLAMNQIGWMYRNEEGVIKNIPTAIEWCTKTANQGDKWAQGILGEIYQNEDEVKDLQKAVNWYQMALDNDHPWAKSEVNKLNEQGYYAKEEQKENETIQDNNATDIINNVQRQPFTSSNNDEHLSKAIDDKMNATEEALRSKIGLMEVNTDSLQKELAALKQKELQQHEENMKLRDELAKIKARTENISNDSLNYDSSNNANGNEDNNATGYPNSGEQQDNNNATANKTIMEENNDAFQKELTVLEQTQLQQHEESNQLSDKLTMLKAGTKDIINNDLSYHLADSKHNSDNDINYDSESTNSEEEGSNDDDNTVPKYKENKLPEKELVETEPVIQDDAYYDTSDTNNDNDFNYDTACSDGEEEEDENNTITKRNAEEVNNDALQKELAFLKQKELEQDEENQLLKERLARIKAGLEDEAHNDPNCYSSDDESDKNNDINYDSECSNGEDVPKNIHQTRNHLQWFETPADPNYDSSDNEDPRNGV